MRSRLQGRTGEVKWVLKEHEGKRCEGGRDNGKTEEWRKVKITREGKVGGKGKERVSLPHEGTRLFVRRRL